MPTEKDVAILAGVLMERAHKGDPISYNELIYEGVAQGARNRAPIGVQQVLSPIYLACEARGLPRLTLLAVPKASVDKPGAPLGDRAFDDDGFIHGTKLTADMIPDERERVYKFDWSLVASVLTDPKTYEAIEEERNPITRRVTRTEAVLVDALIRLVRDEASEEDATLLREKVIA